MYFCNAKERIMEFKYRHTGLFADGKKLLLDPKTFWAEKQTSTYPENVVAIFYLPMVLIVAVGVLLGEIISNPEFLWSYALLKALRELVSYLLQFFVTVSVLAALLKNFKGTANKNALYHVFAYSLLPFLITSFITGLFPGLYIISVAGLYGFYLFALGVQTCLELPSENRARFIILGILLIILIFGMINVITWKLLLAIFPYGA